MKIVTKLILLLLLSFSAVTVYAQPTFVGTTVTDPDTNPPGTNPSVGSGNEFDYNVSQGIDLKIDIDPANSRVTCIFGANANFIGPSTYRYIFSGGDLNAFTSITKNNTLSTKTDHAHMTASVSGKTITFSFDATGVDASVGNIVFDFVATATTPTISTTGTLSAFSTCSGTASAAQSFSVSGSNLTANISITPPSGFEVSTSATFASNVGNNGTPLTLTQSGGTVSSTTVYARLSTSATGTPSGNIAIASTGATTKNVAASGTVNSLPTITLGSVSSVSTSATSFSLPYSATTGSPNQYSITTGSPTAMAGFSAVSNTTLVVSPISVTIPASSAATYNFSLTVKNSTTGCISNANAFTVVVAAASPTISITGTLSSVNTTYGTASATPTSFSVSGANMTNDITVTPPSGFEISKTSSTSGYGGSGVAVTLTNVSGTISATTIHLRLTATAAVGTYSGTISCTSTGATTVTTATVSSTVSAKALTVTANNVNKTYGVSISGAAGSTAFTATGLVNSETISTVTVAYGTGSAANAAVNTYAGTVTPSAATGGTFTASNYSITYSTGNIIVGAAPLTVTANTVNKTYGVTITGAAGSTAFTATGLVNSETISTVTVAYGTGSAATAAVNTYVGSVTPSSATGGTFTASNYSITYSTGNIIVGAAPLTVTANNVNKTYGVSITGAAGSTAFSATGLVNSETISTVTVAYGTGSAVTAAVNTYVGSVTPSLATGGTFTASNYSITYNTGNIIVGAAPLTVTANNVNKTYGVAITGAAGSTAFTVTGLVNSETISTVTVAYGTGSAATDAVSTYPTSITPSSATGGTFTASNYTITYAKGNIIVGAAPLTVTANNVNKTYGVAITGAAGSTAFTVTGLVNSETISTVTVAYGSGSAANAAVNTYAGTVTPSSATGGTFTSGNYSITYSSGNIIVGAAPLTITASDANRTYGETLTGAAGSSAFSSTGLQNSETIGSVTIGYATGIGNGNDATDAVGTYTGKVTSSAATGGTFTAGNYTITYNTGNIIVGAAALTITATNQSKTAGTTATLGTSAFTVTGIKNSETVGSVTLSSTGAASSATVGTYPIVPSAATGGSFASSNYTITYINGTLQVLASTNANLSALSLSSGTLSPVFTSGTTSYTANVGNAISSVTVTPVVDEASATVTVNGTAVTSGNASGAIALSVGNNTVNIVVTAGDGTTTKTYTVTITRAAASASNNADLSALSTSSGTLSPGFASATTSYNISVSASSITVTPTRAEATATITVNGTVVASGSASGAIALNVGNNTITIVVTAGDGTTTKTYTLTVNRAASSNADLSGLIISSGTLTPGFATGTLNYTATVSNSTASVTVTPTSAEISSIITVNGITTTSGSASAAINLLVGSNTITVKLTAQDGITTKNYVLAITRSAAGASNNADLSGLSISSGTLAPGFASGTLDYTASVSNGTAAITVTPTRAESTATITVNGIAVAGGTASGSIALNVGNNIISVIVTAGDGTTTKTYTLTVNRAASSNADLSGLIISSGTLAPSFATGTLNYTATVTNSTTSITVTPTSAEISSTITVNGITTTSGSASGAINLSVGSNTITLKVTAQDGTTIKNYVLTVTRSSAAPSNNANLSGLVISNGTLSPVFDGATTSYAMQVSDNITAVTVTPTAADAGASIKVNNTTVASGSSTSAIGIPDDANTISIAVTAADAITVKTYTVTITKPRTTWNGNTSNAWTNTANWSNGVPDTIKLAVIPNVTTSPVVSTTEKIRNINLNTGAAITITGNLQVIGNMINNGTISGTGLLTFNGTLAQTISGNGIVGNLTVDNSNGISITAGNGNTLKISGILSMNNGTLTTNNNLVLLSDASGTASVAPIPGSAVISGLVTVQRWIGVQRGYRAFGHPFNSALPLSQLSDNFSISGSGDGFVTGLGYSTASVTYYDSVATNPALFKKALSNAPNKISTLSWSVNRGILALVRGQGIEGLGGTYVSANQPSAFAADATGTLNQGVLNDYVLGANTTGTSFNLVGNPFAAPVNIKLLKSNGGNPLYANNNAATGVGNTIYVYNPYKNAGVSSIPSQEVRGGLDAYTNDGNTDIIIPAFGAFFIQAKALGNVIKFDETVKAVSGIPVAVMGNRPATAKLNLEIVNDKGSWDDLKLRWDNKANAAGTDSYDGVKLNNELFDFYSLSSDNRKLCIDSRSDSFNREEIIPLGISTNVAGNNFRIKVSQYELPVNMRVYLRDKLLKTERLLSGTGDDYAFSITTDTATKGDNRFELSVKIAQQSIPTPDASSDVLKVLPNPFKDELVIRLGSNMLSTTGNTHVRMVDILGRVIKTVTAGPNTSLIKLNTHALASGIYVVEVANDKNQITKQVIKQ